MDNQHIETVPVASSKKGAIIILSILVVLLAVSCAGLVAYIYQLKKEKGSMFATEVTTTTQASVTTSSVIVATTTQKTPFFDFREIRRRNPDGYFAPLSAQDMENLQIVISILATEGARSWYTAGKTVQIEDIEYAALSSGYMFIIVTIPKGGAGVDAYVIDMKNKKMTDSFYSYRRVYLDSGVHVFIDRNMDDLRYYMYGASSSQVFAGSVLASSTTSYVGWEGGEGSSGIGIIATTTDSITVGIFDWSNPYQKPGDDIVTPKKIGERTFTVPRP